MKTIKNTQLSWRSIATDEVEYQMLGNMFLVNQIRITFVICCHLNVFQATFRMSFGKVDVWPTGIMWILILNTLIEKVESAKQNIPTNVFKNA